MNASENAANAVPAPGPGFTLLLSDSERSERYEGVRKFIGADDSGVFGILPHHAPLVAVLRYGLARFAAGDGTWRYLALPGGVLQFADNTLTLATVRYFLGDEREAMVARLSAEMRREDSDLQNLRSTLAEIERTLMRRLGALGGTLQQGLAR